MALNVFYVRADTEEGENLDLLVRAATKEQATSLWRGHYELGNDHEPEWVGLVPGVTANSDEAGAIDWASIS